MGWKHAMNRRPAGSNKRVGALKFPTAERGISLLETLIALALGLMVMAGVLQFVSSLVQGNTTTLNVTRLEQDVRTLMDIMVQDIRRAGQFPEAASNLGDPIRFVQDQPTAPMIDGQPLRDGLNGSSITYAYRESDGKLVSGRFSHDAKAGTILMHTGTASAAETISDPAFMTVSILQFQSDLTQLQTGSVSLAMPSLQVRIVVRLKSDPAIERELVDRITWRNPVVASP